MSQPNRAAFLPQGNTVLVTAATTAPMPAQAPVTSGQQSFGCFRIINEGAVTAFLGVGNTAALATANAVVPAPSAAALVLLPGAVEVIQLSPDVYFTALTSSSTARIFITPGLGL